MLRWLLCASLCGATPALSAELELQQWLRQLRAGTQLPGVSGIGISAQLHFRGGLQDEVLVSIDGVPLLDPAHLSDFHSLISSIDSRAVASIDAYTCGFPARYGNRLSGVMELSTLQAPFDRF